MNAIAKLAPKRLREDVRSYVHGELSKIEHEAKRRRGTEYQSEQDFRDSDLRFVRERTRQLFRRRIKEGEYKALPFFLSLILEAVISWAIRRFLEWRFPRK